MKEVHLCKKNPVLSILILIKTVIHNLENRPLRVFTVLQVRVDLFLMGWTLTIKTSTSRFPRHQRLRERGSIVFKSVLTLNSHRRLRVAECLTVSPQTRSCLGSKTFVKVIQNLFVSSCFSHIHGVSLVRKLVLVWYEGNMAHSYVTLYPFSQMNGGVYGTQTNNLPTFPKIDRVGWALQKSFRTRGCSLKRQNDRHSFRT